MRRLEGTWESPGSQTLLLARGGTAQSGRAGGASQGRCPGGSAATGWGARGTSSALPVSRSSGGQPGGGGCCVPKLSGSPIPGPTLGRGWGVQDRPDLCGPGPGLSGEPVTSRRQALPGLGQLWAAWCHDAFKLINTAAARMARDAHAGSWRPRG